VDIDIPRMLLALRRRLADGDPGWGVPRNLSADKLTFGVWSRMIQHRGMYETGMRLGAAGQKVLAGHKGKIDKLPYPIDGWTRQRDLRPLAGKSFIRRWQEKKSGSES